MEREKLLIAAARATHLDPETTCGLSWSECHTRGDKCFAVASAILALPTVTAGEAEHTVTITFGDGYPSHTFQCNAGPESLCRAEFSCDCEQWYNLCVRNGVPAHQPDPLDADAWHAGVLRAGECNHKEWFDNADDTPLDGAVTVAVTPQWHTDYETFTIDAPTPSVPSETQLTEAKAQGWDKGFECGFHAQRYDRRKPNPYRASGLSVEGGK